MYIILIFKKIYLKKDRDKKKTCYYIRYMPFNKIKQYPMHMAPCNQQTTAIKLMQANLQIVCKHKNITTSIVMHKNSLLI